MFQPENEQGVIVRFAQQADEAGFEILRIGSEFPDALVERGGIRYRAEFEYRSASFRQHGHDPRECDLVICWQDDGDCGGLPVLALSKPQWQEQPIELADAQEKEVAYWQWRAERAERRLASTRKQLDVLSDEEEFLCPNEWCNRSFDNGRALAGHLRWCKRKEEQS